MEPLVNIAPDHNLRASWQLARWRLDTEHENVIDAQPAPHGRPAVPVQLVRSYQRCEFRLYENDPGAVQADTPVRQPAPIRLFLRQLQRFSGKRLLQQRDRNAIEIPSAEALYELAQQLPVPIQTRQERMGQPVLRLGILIEQVAHDSRVWAYLTALPRP